MKYALVTAVAGVFICTALAAKAQTEATDGGKPPGQLWQQFEAGNFESEQDMARVVNALATQGQPTIDFLASRLEAARDDEERLDITYITALALTHGRQKSGEPLNLPADMQAQLVSLLKTTDNLSLQANIVNLATSLGPRAAPFIEGMLTVLRKVSHPGLRASTQYALGAIGNDVLPALYDEIRVSGDERVIGDIALILRGQTIPPDILDILRKHLASENAEVREQVFSVLKDTGIEPQELVRAAVENLEKSDNDMSRMMAAFELDTLSPPRNVLIAALAGAIGKFDPARTSSERVQVALLLMKADDEGLLALAAATRAATTAPEKLDLVKILAMNAKDDPAVIDTLMTMALENGSEELTGASVKGLIDIGKPALPAIEAAIRKSPPEEVLWHLNMARNMIGSRP